MTALKETHIRIPTFSFSRIWTIGAGTVTQLVRMKTFYFLLVFALLVAGLGNVDIKSASPAAQLETIKKVSFGSMDIFAWLYAIVATALLIPRDLEDRTLYTILSKPVRRIEYLIGKLLGVLILIAASLAIMFTLCMVMLSIKQYFFAADEYIKLSTDHRMSQETIDAQVKLINQQGVRPALAIAALASFFKASVVAAMAIMISTFASSSLFTIITSIFFFLIGHAHGMMTEFWLNKTDGNLVIRMITKVFKLLIPDYQLYSFSEGIVIGAAVIPQAVWSMGFLTTGYLFIFLLISLMIFLYKEF